MQMKETHRGMLEMALCAVLWSSAGILIKQVPWNAMVISGLRSLIAGLVIWVYMKATGLKWVWSRYTLAIGGMLCLTCTCFMMANKLTSAANAIVLQYTAPVFLLVFSAIFKHQRFRRGDYLAVFFTLIGITLFFLDQLAPGALLGNLFAILAGASFGGMMACMTGIDTPTRMSALFQGQMMTALVGIPFLCIYGLEPSVPAILSLLALGIFQLGIPYLLYGLATATCSPLACVLLAAVEPILNPLWVFLLTGEAPGQTALWGGVLVVLSVTAWCVWDHRVQAQQACSAKS